MLRILFARGRHFARWRLPRVEYFLEILISEKESITSQSHTVIWVVTLCIEYSESIAGWGQTRSRGGLKETPRKEHCVYRTEWGRVPWTKRVKVGKSLYLFPVVTWAAIYLNQCLHLLRVGQFLKTVDGMLTSQTGALALVNTSQEILSLSTCSLVSLSPSGHMEYSMTQTPQCQTNSSVFGGELNRLFQMCPTVAF